MSQSVESSQEVNPVIAPVIAEISSQMSSQISSTTDVNIQPIQPTVDSNISSTTNSSHISQELEIQQNIDNIEDNNEVEQEIEIEPPAVEDEIQPYPESVPEFVDHQISISSRAGSTLSGSDRQVYIAPTPVRQVRPDPKGLKHFFLFLGFLFNFFFFFSDIPVYRHLNGG